MIIFIFHKFVFQIIYEIYCRYNITTGLYPFEGDNIYRLLENIGKEQWIAPDFLDPVLADLLINMLQMEPLNRFSLQQIKNHEFYKCAPVKNKELLIPVPPLKNGDKLKNSTVLPYLENYHYDTDSRDDRFLTEHQLNIEGKF